MQKVLLIMSILILTVFVAGCVNSVTAIVDPCQSQFEQCNYNCGEGLLAGFCKEKCTFDYNECKKNS